MKTSRHSCYRPAGVITLALLLVLVLVLTLVSPAGAQQCAVGGDNRAQPQPASRCNPQAAPASHPNAEPTTGSGLSIDLVSGNKYLEQTDAVWPGGLVLRRHYNSRNQFAQSMGPGWRHGFDTVLALRKVDHGWEAQVIQADGRRIVFREQTAQARPDNNNLLVPSNPLYGSIQVQAEVSVDRRFRWRWRDGSSFYFSDRGQLTATERSTGDRLYLHYEQISHAAGSRGVSAKHVNTGGLQSSDRSLSRLQRVTNRYGQQFVFQYNPLGLLTRVTLPDQSYWEYRYDANQVLGAVWRKLIKRWSFDYDDDQFSALTAVRDQHGTVKGLYRYANGRAVYSSATGQPDDPLAISVQYKIPTKSTQTGVSIVADANLRKTSYKWRYDARRQERQLLSSLGPGCRVCPSANLVRHYDNKGRPVALQRHDGKFLRRWHYDAVGRLSKITSPNQYGEMSTHHFDYDGLRFDAQVIRIRRASIAPGKFHVVTLGYNNLGQIETITETGYGPVVSSLRSAAIKRGIRPWQATKWEHIRRQTNYTYVQTGAAQGLVAAVDGPLPGADDTTQMFYDNAGRLQQVAGPGGMSMRYKYDRDGYVSARVSDNGSHWQIKRNPDGTDVQVLHRGVTIQEQFDEAGRLTTRLSSNQPAIRLQWSAIGDLKRISNDNGQWLTHETLGLAPDRLIALNKLVRNPPQFDPVITTAAGAVITRQRPKSNEVERRVVDDFNRVVAIVDSARGVQRNLFDQADRLVASAVYANGQQQPSRTLYRYDKRGNLAGMADADGSLMQNIYDNGRLRLQRQRFQTLHFSEEPTTLNHRWAVNYHDPVSGMGFTKPLEFSRIYDQSGRLHQRQLPGGWEIQYTWTKSNRLESVSLHSPKGVVTTLAEKLQWLPFTNGQRGLLFAQYGNGTHQKIDHDSRLRVHKVSNGSGMPTQTLSYDSGGRTVSQQIDTEATNYRYDARNRMVGWQIQAGPKKANNRAQVQEPGVHSKPRWATDGDGRVRLSRNSTGLVTRYLYNMQRERIGKIMVGDPSRSRWFIYEQRRVFMQTSASGQPLVAFLYLDGRPFAMLRFDARGAITPYWVHTDHRGLPLAVSDENGRNVWNESFGPYGAPMVKTPELQPLGLQPISHQVAKMSTGLRGAIDDFMPLRLPGQYFDTDTGLHDNYQRSYNPATGKYLGPDPLGLRAGADRYRYAAQSPMDTTDPLGLYEIDVHYYMTYFLARMAGISHTDANVIAHATQGIDDNPQTQPIDYDSEGNIRPLTPLVNQERLLAYHFVLHYRIGPVVVPQPSLSTANPQSPQLDNLMRSISTATNGCTQMQLLGEMLHAYEDTYAHRDALNMPFDPVVYGLGIGHGLAGHYPDHTYNSPPFWFVNESRTWQMEQDTYQRLLEFGDSNAAIPIEQFEEVLRAFNSTRENDSTGFAQKLALLDHFMRDNGIMVDTDGRLQSAQFSSVGNERATVQYVRQDALDNRSRHLCGREFSSTGIIAPAC
ncbi:MAG: DUF6765 family protein [Burkholderiaceae bacterium]